MARKSGRAAKSASAPANNDVEQPQLTAAARASGRSRGKKPTAQPAPQLSTAPPPVPSLDLVAGRRASTRNRRRANSEAESLKSNAEQVDDDTSTAKPETQKQQGRKRKEAPVRSESDEIGSQVSLKASRRRRTGSKDDADVKLEQSVAAPADSPVAAEAIAEAKTHDYSMAGTDRHQQVTAAATNTTDAIPAVDNEDQHGEGVAIDTTILSPSVNAVDESQAAQLVSNVLSSYSKINSSNNLLMADATRSDVSPLTAQQEQHERVETNEADAGIDGRNAATHPAIAINSESDALNAPMLTPRSAPEQNIKLRGDTFEDDSHGPEVASKEQSPAFQMSPLEFLAQSAVAAMDMIPAYAPRLDESNDDDDEKGTDLFAANEDETDKEQELDEPVRVVSRAEPGIARPADEAEGDKDAQDESENVSYCELEKESSGRSLKQQDCSASVPISATIVGEEKNIQEVHVPVDKSTEGAESKLTTEPAIFEAPSIPISVTNTDDKESCEKEGQASLLPMGESIEGADSKVTMQPDIFDATSSQVLATAVDADDKKQEPQAFLLPANEPTEGISNSTVDGVHQGLEEDTHDYSETISSDPVLDDKDEPGDGVSTVPSEATAGSEAAHESNSSRIQMPLEPSEQVDAIMECHAPVDSSAAAPTVNPEMMDLDSSPVSAIDATKLDPEQAAGSPNGTLIDGNGEDVHDSGVGDLAVAPADDISSQIKATKKGFVSKKSQETAVQDDAVQDDNKRRYSGVKSRDKETEQMLLQTRSKSIDVSSACEDDTGETLSSQKLPISQVDLATQTPASSGDMMDVEVSGLANNEHRHDKPLSSESNDQDGRSMHSAADEVLPRDASETSTVLSPERAIRNNNEKTIIIDTLLPEKEKASPRATASSPITRSYESIDAQTGTSIFPSIVPKLNADIEIFPPKCLTVLNLERVKLSLFLEGRRSHRGRQYERLFTQYWTNIRARLKDEQTHSEIRQCDIFLDRFLITRKLRKLHNKLIMGLMDRCLRPCSPVSIVGKSIPAAWKNRVFASSLQALRERPTHTVTPTPLAEVEAMRHAFEEHGDQNPIEVAHRFGYRDTPMMVLPDVVVDRAVLSKSGSTCIPGALAIDPRARSLCSAANMSISENAVWLLVAATKHFVSDYLSQAIETSKAVSGLGPTLNEQALIISQGKDQSSKLSQVISSEANKTRCGKLCIMDAADMHLLASGMSFGSTDLFGGSFSSRIAFEKSLHASTETGVGETDAEMVAVKRFLTGKLSVFGPAEERRLLTSNDPSVSEPVLSSEGRGTGTSGGLGRGAKDLASLKARATKPESTRASPVGITTPPAASPNRTTTPSAAVDVDDKHATSPGDKSDGGQQSARRGKGFGIKNLAAIRARSVTSTSAVEDSSVQAAAALVPREEVKQEAEATGKIAAHDKPLSAGDETTP